MSLLLLATTKIRSLLAAPSAALCRQIPCSSPSTKGVAHLQSLRHRHAVPKFLFAMDTAYFRERAESAAVQINFHYVNPKLQLDRVFNLQRSLTETLESCLNRIRSNLEKELLKKRGRNKKKKVVPADASATPEAESQLEPEPAVSLVQLMRDNHPVDGQTLLQDVLDACPPIGPSGLLLDIFGVQFGVSCNLPWVNQIVLPTSMMDGYFVYPTKLDMECAELRDCGFEWFRAATAGEVTSTEWIRVGEAFQWIVTPECIGHRIKVICTPRNGIHSGPSVESISKSVVTEGPKACLFVPRHAYTAKRLAGNEFRVVSFNLLADLYADSDYSRTVLFPYCPPHALAIDYRKQLIVRELLGYQADLMCLQEVDAKVFDYELQPIFGFRQFGGTFQRKGQTAEGLATYYNTERFSLIEAFGMNIGESLSTLPIYSDLWRHIQTNPLLAARITVRSTAVQVTVLRVNDTDQILCVANTHLYFHPDADLIRLLQFYASFLYVQHVRNTIAERLSRPVEDISIVYCGDFNSTPECGIYRLMTQKGVPADFVDFQSNVAEALTNVTLAQPLNIASAYTDHPFTNYTVGFTECIDYIFYQTDALRLVQTVPTPNEEQLSANVAIPSVCHPSDHVALVADFAWR